MNFDQLLQLLASSYFVYLVTELGTYIVLQAAFVVLISYSQLMPKINLAAVDQIKERKASRWILHKQQQYINTDLATVNEDYKHSYLGIGGCSCSDSGLDFHR